jgi:hypothetical protein
LPRAHDITVSLVGFEKHKARLDLRDPSGFWLCDSGDASPFEAAFNASPAAFHEFLIEQRVAKKTCSSTLSAQIVKIEEGPETRILIRPHPSYGAALGSIAGT